MAHASIRFEMGVNGAFILSEVEMRALDALVGYGDKAFLDVFKDKLGQHYIRNHEAGLRSFFAAVRRQVIPALSEVDRYRRDLRAAIDARNEAETARRADPS